MYRTAFRSFFFPYSPYQSPINPCFSPLRERNRKDWTPWKDFVSSRALSHFYPTISPLFSHSFPIISLNILSKSYFFTIISNLLHKKKRREKRRRKKDLALSLKIWLCQGVLPWTMEVPGKEKEMRGKKREGQLEIVRMRKIALERIWRIFKDSPRKPPWADFYGSAAIHCCL